MVFIIAEMPAAIAGGSAGNPDHSTVTCQPALGKHVLLVQLEEVINIPIQYVRPDIAQAKLILP
jgi:hypothetical protein